MKISTMALGAALAVAASATTVATPAFAAKKEDQAAKPSFKLTKAVRENIGAAQKAIEGNDLATAKTSVDAAQAAIATPDDKYVVGMTRLNIAGKSNDTAGQAAAIDLLVDSGSDAAKQDLPKLLRNQGAIAYQAKNMAKAEAAYTRLAEVEPTPDNLVSLAEIKYQVRKPQEALATLDRAVAAQKAAGQPVNENWYKRGLAIAYESKLKPETNKWALQLVQAYPNPTAWRNALQIYRMDNQLDDSQSIDLFRLARAAKALNGERDYFEYANIALERGLPGEASTVVSEGFASGNVATASKSLTEIKSLASPKIAADKASLPASEKRAATAADGKPAMGTGDAYLGYGDYAKAAAMYKLALSKGGVDAATANTRLGIALANLNQKNEALAAFAQVQGARKPLADWWTIWLNQKA